MFYRVLVVFFSVFIFNYSFVQAQQFSEETLWSLNYLSGGTVSPDESMVLYSSRSYNVTENKGASKHFVLNLKNNTTSTLEIKDVIITSPRWSSDNRIIFMERLADGKQQISSVLPNGSDVKSIGVFTSGTVNEFKFSPKESYLVVLQSVKTKSTLKEKHSDLPQANVRMEDDLMYRHWDSWSDEYSQQLFLYTLKDGQLTGSGKNILAGEVYDGILPPFGGLEDVCFSPDEEQLIYTSKKMKGKAFATSTNSDLYSYSILNGEKVNLTKDYKGYDMHPAYSPTGKKLAWLSMARDGFEADKNDLIIRDLTTGEDVNVTKNHDVTVSGFKWSKDEKSIYLLLPKHGTVQIFELDLKKNSLEQLTDGVHNYTSLDEVGKDFIAMRQSMLVPNELYRVNKKNGSAEQLTESNEEQLQHLRKPTVEKRWITTSDNKRMLTWVILPPDFDSSKKYPALLYCQGGPQSAVSQFFSTRWNFRLMASKGYVIIAPNRRGLPGFGQEWNDAISQDWGGQPMRDYLSAVDAVKKESYVDENRIGAVGASYGGYSVFNLAGMHEGRFKTFISHCGLFNMTSWYGTTEELFFANWELGGPYWKEENKQQYIDHSPHTKVDKWDTPILIIQGGKDFRVPESQSFEAFQAARLKGLKSKLLYFPDENHWVLQPQNAMVWQREFFEWLKETL